MEEEYFKPKYPNRRLLERIKGLKLGSALNEQQASDCVNIDDSTGNNGSGACTCGDELTITNLPTYSGTGTPQIEFEVTTSEINIQVGGGSVLDGPLYVAIYNNTDFFSPPYEFISDQGAATTSNISMPIDCDGNQWPMNQPEGSNYQIMIAELYPGSTQTGLNNIVDYANPCDSNNQTHYYYDFSAAFTIDLEAACAVPGCTDSAANNYNENATEDDGSCNYDVYGCTDPTAFNYNSAATADDGSCEYEGCMDPAADNYDSNADEDDGSCQYGGCTNSDADNYDSNATTDDGSCIISGCQDETAVNFNPEANNDQWLNGCVYDFTCDNFDEWVDILWQNTSIDDVISADELICDVFCLKPGNLPPSYVALSGLSICECCIEDIPGCTDPAANNYNSEANQDDGSCTYDPECLPIEVINTPEAINSEITTVEWQGGCPDCGNGNVYISLIAEGAYASQISANWEAGDAGGTILLENDGTHTWTIPCDLIQPGETYYYFISQVDCDLNPAIYNGAESLSEAGYSYSSTILIDEDACPVLGCTDPDALNYNEDANTDDGSCVDAVPGCTSPTAINFNPLANSDDGSCEYSIHVCQPITSAEMELLGNECVETISSIPATGEDEYATLESCQASGCEDSPFTPIAGPVEGCTESYACNYNPEATQDNGTCEYESCMGCMDDSTYFNIETQQEEYQATNYDPEATVPGPCNGCFQQPADNGFFIGIAQLFAVDSGNATGLYDDILPEGWQETEPWISFQYSCLDCCVYSGCSDPTAINFDPMANPDNQPTTYGQTWTYLDDGSCEYAGCTDIDANNYNAEADYDDGSCLYDIFACENVTNNPPPGEIAEILYQECMESESSEPANGETTFVTLAECQDVTGCVKPEDEYGGCTDDTAINYDPNADYDDGSCEYQEGCTQFGAINFNPNAIIDDGSCLFEITCYNCIDEAEVTLEVTEEEYSTACIGPIIVEYPDECPEKEGCTDPDALNYDPLAEVDDGSCEYPPEEPHKCTPAGCLPTPGTEPNEAEGVYASYDDCFNSGCAPIECLYDAQELYAYEFPQQSGYVNSVYEFCARCGCLEPNSDGIMIPVEDCSLENNSSSGDNSDIWINPAMVTGDPDGPTCECCNFCQDLEASNPTLYSGCEDKCINTPESPGEVCEPFCFCYDAEISSYEDEDEDEVEGEFTCDELDSWLTSTFGEGPFTGAVDLEGNTYDIGTVDGFCDYCQPGVEFTGTFNSDTYYAEQCACCPDDIDPETTYSCLAGAMGPECQAVSGGNGDFATIEECEAEGCGPTEEDPCIAFDNAGDPQQQQLICSYYFQYFGGVGQQGGNNPGNFDESTLEAFANITNNGYCCEGVFYGDEFSINPPQTSSALPPTDIPPTQGDFEFNTNCTNFNNAPQDFQDLICTQCEDPAYINMQCECCPQAGLNRMQELAGIK